MKQDIVKLGIDLYKNRVTSYSNNQANDVIRKAFVEIIGTDKPDFRQFRRYKNDIFEIIEEVLDQTITDGMIASPFFEQFVDYRDLALGDTNEFYVEDRTMLVAARHSGNHWNIRRQKLNIGDTFTVQTEPYAIAIYTDFKRFLAGRIDWDAFIKKVSEAFAQELNSRIYTEFMASMAYLPAEFKQTGTYNDSTLIEQAEHVQAANQGSQIIIAGTRTALSKLSGASALLSENMKDQINKNGVLQVWNGYSLLPIPQSHKPNTFEFQIANDRLMVLPANAKPIKVVKEGTPFIKEVSDGTTNQDMSMEYKFITQYGVDTVFNVMYGMYQFA
ncbi:hypothetical protein MOE21_17280 [Bacillus atrophaeus]|uniref:hypothetical protein n=1 Tax=Bacillus atrophaeus TaxID=1452 RepID=UPI002280BC26|nr:hypothetical protein [Bacillus atrophaeus]MCY8934341.1 hypothetical protein [Bacillus atrophaeus]